MAIGGTAATGGCAGVAPASGAASISAHDRVRTSRVTWPVAQKGEIGPAHYGSVALVGRVKRLYDHGDVLRSPRPGDRSRTRQCRSPVHLGSVRHFRGLAGMGRRVPGARRAGRSLQAIRGHARRRGRTGCSRRWPNRTRSASSPTGSGTTRRSLRPGPARQHSSTRRRQRVQLLFARWRQATSWFSPELLTLPLDDRARVDGRGRRRWRCTASRSKICSASRRTCSTSRASGCCRSPSRLGGVPQDAYAALSTADARFPTITLSTGEAVQVSYGQYRKLLATCRSPGGPARGLRSALRHLRREPQHLRHALQRRDAARLVRGAGARLRDHARRGALRQRHPAQRSSRT